MRTSIAIAAMSLLVLAGCSSEAEPVEDAAPAPTSTTPVEASEIPIALGEPFTIEGANYTADITIERVYIPAMCGDQPNENPAIVADVQLASGDGTQEVLNTGTIRERTPDGYIQRERTVSRSCDGIQELEAMNAQTGDKYRGAIWLKDDVDPESEILINAPAGDGPITEVFVLGLGEMDLGAPVTVTQTPAPEATAPAANAEPTVLECLQGTPGPARWSDGTTRYSEWCYQTRGGPVHDANEGNSGLYGPNHQELLRQQAEAIQQGRASGDVQMENGCQTGFIDEDTCAMAGY